MSIYSVTTGRPEGAEAAGAGASIPLYVAGLVVLLAGISAVTYEMDEPGFTFFMNTLTTLGVMVSYFLRRLGVPTRWIKVGALGLCVVFLYALRGAGPFGSILPLEAQTNQDMLLACALAVTATFFSFLLLTDDMVVFTCVFTIALIGLTGTVNINNELIACFLVFLGAAIFLLVHQNYLQNRPRQEPLSWRAWLRILRTQVALGLVCGLTAIVIGFLIAIPLQMAGRNLSLAGIIQRLRVSPSAGQGLAPRGGSSLVFDDPQRFEVGLGPVDDDRRVVMIVEGDKSFYWRGRTFEEYTGTGWQSRLSDRRIRRQIEPAETLPNRVRVFRLPRERLPRTAVRRYVHRFLPQGVPSYALYGAAEARVVRAPLERINYRLDNTIGTSLWSTGGDMIEAYEVESEVSEATDAELRRAGQTYPSSIKVDYLLQGVDPANETLVQLAAEATAGFDTPFEKAEAIRRFVAERCTYTLDAPAVPRDQDAAEHFLNVTREGYCDLYATAATVLCRYAGLPARVATGFLPGTASGSNPRQYMLRGIDRHAWAEVYFPGYGWIPFDATTGTNVAQEDVAVPGAPEAGPLERLVSRGPLPLILLAAGILILLYVCKTELWDRWRRGVPASAGRAGEQHAAQIAALYQRSIKGVARRGVARPPTMTPSAYVARVRAYLGDDVADALARLTALAERAFYGPETITESEVREAHRTAAAIRAAVKGAKGGRLGRETAAAR